MKYILIAVMLFAAQSIKAQSISDYPKSISLDSVIINMIDARIAKLPLLDNQAVSKLVDSKIALIPSTRFNPLEVLITKVSDTLNTAAIVGHAEMVKAPVVAAKASADVVALTNLVNTLVARISVLEANQMPPAVLTRITTLETQMTSTAAKIAGLKATTISTTTIQ